MLLYRNHICTPSWIDETDLPAVLIWFVMIQAVWNWAATLSVILIQDLMNRSRLFFLSFAFFSRGIQNEIIYLTWQKHRNSFLCIYLYISSFGRRELPASVKSFSRQELLTSLGSYKMQLQSFQPNAKTQIECWECFSKGLLDSFGPLFLKIPGL